MKINVNHDEDYNTIEAQNDQIGKLEGELEAIREAIITRWYDELISSFDEPLEYIPTILLLNRVIEELD